MFTSQTTESSTIIKTKIKVIVFDFDNCIALDEETKTGSEEIKDQAWFAIFPEYNHQALNTIVEQAKAEVAGGKGDRQDIALKILRHFGLPEEQLTQAAAVKCQLFNQYIQEKIGSIKITPTTRGTLATLAKQLPLYINTATPQAAAIESLETLTLKHFFKDVLGRPGTKIENLEKIIQAESVQANEVMFIDDQPSGWQAAQAVGCIFLGIATAKNTLWRRQSQPFPIINSLSEIPLLLK